MIPSQSWNNPAPVKKPAHAAKGEMDLEVSGELWF